MNTILCEGSHLNNTPSHKSNRADTEDKSSERNKDKNYKSENEGGTNNGKRALMIGKSIVKNIEEWRLNKIIKSIIAVKSVHGAISKL